MSYAADFYDQIRHAAIYVDKILRGSRPSDLPIEQPAKLEVINVATARALGVTIPAWLLLQADRLIE
jgi:putative ABC transport system substrate-binding protein